MHGFWDGFAEFFLEILLRIIEAIFNFYGGNDRR